MKGYESYKDSGVEWIGEIPSHWVFQKGSRIGAYSKGSGIKKDEVKNAGLPCIRYGEIYTKYNHKFETVQTFIEEGVTKVKVGYGTLFMTGSGELLEDIGKCVVYVGVEDLYVGGDIIILKPFEENDCEFLSYQINSECIRIQRELNGRGGIIAHIYSKNFKDMCFPVPPLSEQQQIVSFLDTKTALIDSLIEKTQRKIELLKEKRTSLINEVVTKGLNPNVEMKDSGVEWIGKIPIHYQMISIKFLVTTPVTDGPHETPEFVDEGIPFLSVNGVVGNKINFNKVRGYITNELHIEYSKKCKPQRDDVLLVKSGSTTGKSTIVETDLNFNIWSPLCIIRSNTNKIIPRFTFHTFQSGYFIELIENNWSYGTQPNIGMNVIENLSIVVPPISEQQQIVAYLDEQTGLIDKTISIEEKRIELLEAYRQSLISEVVTGKRKVVA